MAITLVQSKRGTKTGGLIGSITVTLDDTPTEGNVLVLVYGSQNSSDGRSISVDSITQTNVSWSLQIQKEGGAGNYADVEIWLGVVGASPGTGIVVDVENVNTESACAVNVSEWTEIDTDAPLDKTATNAGTSASADTGTTAVTAQADELWVGGTVAYCNVNTLTQSNPTNGFTLIDGATFTDDGGWYFSEAYLYKVVSGTAAANSGTTIVRSATWIGCIATFLGAGGAAVPIGAISGGHYISHIKGKIKGG